MQNELNRTLLDDNTRALQAITAEVRDYAQRMVEDSTATFSELARARSLPEAFGRLAAYNKRAMEEYIQQFARLSTMYSSLIDQQTRATQSMMMPSLLGPAADRR
jgi:hypothetical protein